MVHKTSEHRVAVIDIGSNSVRLVVFEGEGRAPAVAFNEKELCGLGRSLSTTGKLNENGVVLALRTLERFVILLDYMQVKDVRAVATAAVRDAENGLSFIAAVEARCNFKVRVLSGKEEARYSALGLLSGIPDADGLVGDLGGGSLELIQVGPNGEDGLAPASAVGENVSLPLGPFLLADSFKKDRAATIARIDATLSDLKWTGSGRNHDFYAVGGAWRALARIHMQQTQYPLHILHHYIIERSELLDVCDVIAHMSQQSLARIPGIPSRRAEHLPLAATILGRIFMLLGPRRMVISALGLREGLLFDAMAPEIRARDPFLEACHDIAAQSDRFPDHAQKLLTWTDPLFADDTPEERRLRLAACMLADVAWRGHPDYRAEKVLMEVLYGRFGGIDHHGSALVALALYLCYGGSLGAPVTADIQRLLAPADIERARRIGMSLRLAQRLSGGTPTAFRLTRLGLGDDELVLRVKAEIHALAGDSVMRRLEVLARLFGRRAKIVPE